MMCEPSELAFGIVSRIAPRSLRADARSISRTAGCG